MSIPRWGSSSRGVTLLAALVLVFLLTGSAIAIQSAMPEGGSLSQAAAGGLLAVDLPPRVGPTAKPPTPPQIPECSAVKEEVLTTKAEKAEKEWCVCLDSKERTHKKVAYKVEAVLIKGNPVAKTTATIGQPTPTVNVLCKVTTCAPTTCAPADKNCTPSSKCIALDKSPSSLAKDLADARTQSVQDYPRYIANGITDGSIKPETLNGQLSKSTQDAIANSFQSDIKSSSLPNALDPYSSRLSSYTDAEKSTAEDLIKNIQTCGASECTGPSPDSIPDSSGCLPSGVDTYTSEKCTYTPPAGSPAASIPDQNGCLPNGIDTYSNKDCKYAGPVSPSTLTPSGGRPDPDKPYWIDRGEEWCNQYGECRSKKDFTPPPGQGGPPPPDRTDKAPCPAGPNCPGRFPEGPSGPTGPTPNNTTGFGSGSGSGLGGLGSLLSGLGRMLGSQHPQPPTTPAQTCSTDPNIYAQQQQQYQQQLQQYNYQLQQYNYQQQLNQYNSQNYGQGYPPPSQPQPALPQQCTPSTGQQCTNQPQQPPAANCNTGNWRAQYSGVCVTGWQCVPSNTNNTDIPTAQLSCQPQVADVGMSLAISYSCSAGTAEGSGFAVTTQPSGSATTTAASPPAGANTGTYSLKCTNNGQTAGAECSIQIGKPSIVLVANPKTVISGATSLIGWITGGIQSCVISSPDQADFTARNASNTSPNGTATTSPITSSATFLLHCQTIAGGTKDATTTVSVK